jgi:fatty acid desaturase
MTTTTTRPDSDFSPLVVQVRAAGWLERRLVYYAGAMTLHVLLFAAVVAGMVTVGPSWWQLALAVPFAVLTTRSGFFGHDAGHQQIAGTRRTNRILGLLHGNLIVGMSHGWWNAKHNRHHANPNHADKDPDVAVGALVWTDEQAADRRGLLGWLTRHQARLFFPMLLLEGIALKITSIVDLRQRSRPDRIVEGGLLAVHHLAYATLLLIVMSPLQALAFAAVHNALLGLHLGCAFAPNHKGMPMPAPGEKWGHLRRQVLTSRNVRGGLVTDWMLGGLNYQIEHHLFPSMPRPSLRLAQPFIREYCEDAGLTYAETGLIESYAQALSHLHSVGQTLRANR